MSYVKCRFNILIFQCELSGYSTEGGKEDQDGHAKAEYNYDIYNIRKRRPY